jgi:hypothetical protein
MQQEASGLFNIRYKNTAVLLSMATRRIKSFYPLRTASTSFTVFGIFLPNIRFPSSVIR